MQIDIDQAYEQLRAHLTIDVGKFFFGGSSLSLGVGNIFDGIRYPLYDEERNIFFTVEGLVYVLTHECDIDQANDRLFNTDLLICPIIPFPDFVSEYQKVLDVDQLRNFITQLAARNVSRVVYLPTIPNHLPYGGLMYLNRITSTNLSAFKLPGVDHICAVTAHGLHLIDQALNNHLLRPKSERLAFQPYN